MERIKTIVGETVMNWIAYLGIWISAEFLVYGIEACIRKIVNITHNYKLFAETKEAKLVKPWMFRDKMMVIAHWNRQTETEREWPMSVRIYDITPLTHMHLYYIIPCAIMKLVQVHFYSRLWYQYIYTSIYTLSETYNYSSYSDALPHWMHVYHTMCHLAACTIKMHVCICAVKSDAS